MISGESVAFAAISGIAGNTSARTGDPESGIGKIFDQEKVQKEIDAQVRITQVFGQLASKAVGDYADSKLKEAQKLREQGREQDAKEIESQWGANGSLRLAAHTVIGGLTGGASGAAGAAAGTLTAPAVADALAKAGVDGPLATALTAIASTAAGAAVGGTAGAGTALNEVANNYLDHRKPNAAALSEKEIYERASEACRGGNDQSCRTQQELATLSAQRDALLAQACAGGPTRECQGLVAEARAMGNVVWGQYGQLVWANSPDKTFPLNVATIGPGPQNTAYGSTFHYQQAGSLSEGLLLSGVGGASAYMGSTATLGRLLAGVGLGGGFDAAGQGFKLYMGTQEEYRPMQTVFAMSSGALAFQLAGTPAFGSPLISNSLLGGTVGATNTTMTNWWYGESESVRNAFLVGGLFGGGGTAVGNIATGQLQKALPLFVGSKPYNPALPILLQNVKPNPYPGQAGFVLEQGVSNIPSFLGSSEGDGK